MKKNINKAFTLVELIVVITILAVLATVAFISFQGYTSSSRDSVRLADLKNISKSFEINRTKWIDFPLPDKKVDISYSGTIFQYQWELSQNILEKDLNIFDGGVDPVTKKPYGYAVNFARNKFQIIWFLENNENTANISNSKIFADNTDKYIKSHWDELWILLDEITKEIIINNNWNITEIDIENNSNNFALVLDEIETWDSEFIKNILSFRINNIESCRSILLNWNSKWDGVYIINPTWILWNEFKVYCDMKTDWGGWTVVLSDDLKTSTGVLKLEDQIMNVSIWIPTWELNSWDHRIIWNWPKYSEFKMQTKYSNGFASNQRISNTWDFRYIWCDLLSFVISHENNSIDYQNGKCSDEMFDDWQDSDNREHYLGYKVFWQYNNTYYYYWQRTFLWKIINTELFRTAHNNSDLWWIDMSDIDCNSSWSDEVCRTSQDIMLQHENTIKRAIFSIR